MATPLAAGAAGMLREHLRKLHVRHGPSAALVKAVLIASAQRLPAPASRLLVDDDQGYGLIDLGSLLKPTKKRKLVDNVRPGLRTGEAWTRSLAVSGALPLRIVLAYTDYPGEARQ